MEGFSATVLFVQSSCSNINLRELLRRDRGLFLVDQQVQILLHFQSDAIYHTFKIKMSKLH